MLWNTCLDMERNPSYLTATNKHNVTIELSNVLSRSPIYKKILEKILSLSYVYDKL